MVRYFNLPTFFAILAFFVETAHAQSWKPLGPDTGRLSTINGWDNQPAIATDTSGVPYIVYTEHDSLRIRVKKFDGTNWVDVGTPSYNFRGRVPSIFITQKDSIYVGYIGRSDSARCRVIKYDGADWVMVGGPIIANADSLFETSLAVDTNGAIYFGFANFYAGGKYANIVTYDGANWVSPGNATFVQNTVRICLHINKNTNELIAGYNINTIGSLYESRLSKWNGTVWDTLGQVLYGIYNFDLAPDGTPFVMTSYGGIVVKLVNNSWVQVSAIGSIPGYSMQLSLDQSGIPYVAIGGSAASVKKYDGSSWKFVGSASFSATDAWDVRMAFGKGVPFITYNTGSTWYNKVYAMYYDESLGISLLQPKSNSVRMYPNPMYGREIFVEGLLPSSYHITLVNGFGQVVYENAAEYRLGNKRLKLTLDLQLSMGMYYLIIDNGTECYSMPLIVKTE